MDNLPIQEEEEKAYHQQYDGFSTADEDMDALEETLPLQSSDGLSIPVPPPPEGELSGKVGFSTPEKFEIVDICFRAYTTPTNPAKSLKCGDFYPLFFASTPPAAWLSIAWIGRRIHGNHDSNPIRVSMHVDDNNNNNNNQVNNNVDLGTPNSQQRKRKNAADQNNKRNRPKKEIMGVQLVDCLDINHLSKEALQLKRICEEHNISFITSTNEDRVQIARSVIDLYYSVMRGGTRKIQLDLLEMLKVGLGYSRSIDLNALRDSVSLTCVASWRGSNLIDVAKNSCHPPFIVYNHDDVLTIEISTFHLKYTIDMERNILYIYFMVNEDEVVKASHFASGLLPIVGTNINPPKTGEKPERHQMVITIPPAFDEESLTINKSTEHVLTLSVKERSRPLRRRLAASNIGGDNNDP